MPFNIRETIIGKVFGGGLQAELAERGIDWLEAEGRKALGTEQETITRVRLTPGETYTVIARPRATGAERKLARRSDALTEAERRLSRPSRRQFTAARRLAGTQKRLDGRRPGTTRWARAAAQERARATRFDKVMSPSKRLARVRAELAEVNGTLDASRVVSLERARRRRRHSRPRTEVFD